MSDRVDLKYARQMAKEMDYHYNKKPEVGKLALMNAPQLYLAKAAKVINQLCQEVEALRGENEEARATLRLLNILGNDD